MTSSNKKGLQAWQSWAIILAVSAGIYFFPWRPGDLRPEALHMLAIFVDYLGDHPQAPTHGGSSYDWLGSKSCDRHGAEFRGFFRFFI